MELERIVRKDYVSERLRIDGKEFIECSFKSCTLLWDSGEARTINCSIENCQIEAFGEVLKFVSVLSDFGMRIVRRQGDGAK
jgi:hypothetical protein